jgi:flavin reductase (DIM6/NTAB) family NADH-FMN oxidoreductase RutF
MQEKWIPVVGKMTYGIYVLTTHYEQKINGMIASWVSQISYDPPLITVAVHPNRYSHHLIQQSGCFALHSLARTQMDFLSHFKGPDPETKFAAVQWERGTTGCPILKDCVAWMECTVKATHKPGNHTLFIGKIVAARLISNAEPLSTHDYPGIYLGQV